MNRSQEDMLCFFASVANPGVNLLRRVREIIDKGVDWEYIARASEALDVSAGLLEILFRAEAGPIPELTDIRRAAAHELAVTALMEDLFRRTAFLLDEAGIPFIPLKGSDIRIAGGSRRLANPMQDIDILVRPESLARTREVLEAGGFFFQGALSGAHYNFALPGEQLRFLEIHWTLINRTSTVQRRIFNPDMEKIWRRSVSLCCRLHLSPEDLLCYTVVHGVKEYYHKPKWAADAEFLIRAVLPRCAPERVRQAVEEWGAGPALGIVAEALEQALDAGVYRRVYTFGAVRPGFLGKMAARRLFMPWGSPRLRSALCLLAASPRPTRGCLAIGIAERVLRSLRRG